MKRTPPAGSRAIDRRQLISALGAGTGSLAAVALGAAGFRGAPLVAQSIQIDSTPPAPPIPAPPPTSGETVDDVAARLTYDADAIFAFVRDEIHYESYSGVLRGANGTLWARAGNAADQAVLLGALLAAAQIPYRFAIGALDAALSESLASHLALTRADAWAALYEATIAASAHALGDGSSAATPEMTLDSAAPPELAPFEATAQSALDLAHASLETSTAAIMGALAAGGVTLPPLELPALTDRELNQHAWIQVPDGPDWLDYDPSLPEGAVAGTPVETPDVLPDDWSHRVKIAVAADDNAFGSLSRREVVAYTATSDALIDVPVAISMAAPEDLSGLGLTLTELFTGQKSIFPSIYADGVTVDAAAPLIFATGEATTDDPFGDNSASGAAEGETLAVWLVVEITSPDEAPIVIERALLDRVPPEDRASGLVVLENIAPVTLAPDALGEQTIPEFNVLPVIHTDVARLPAVNAINRFTGDAVYGGLGLFGPSLAALRDALGEEEEANLGYWSYPSAPNVTVFHVALPTAETATASIAVDLLHRSRTSLPLTDVDPSDTVHPLVLSGLLDAIAEHALLAPEIRGDLAQSSPYEVGVSMAAIVDAASVAATGFRLLTTAADVTGIQADPASQQWITAALDAGQYVVVPETPVAVAGEPLLGWWIVDPATGRTRDQLQNGMAYASTRFRGRPAPFLMQATGEYSFLTRAVLWISSNGRGFLCMGMGIGAGIMWACALIHGLNGGSVGRSAAAGGLASAGGVAGAIGAC